MSITKKLVRVVILGALLLPVIDASGMAAVVDHQSGGEESVKKGVDQSNSSNNEESIRANKRVVQIVGFLLPHYYENNVDEMLIHAAAQGPIEVAACLYDNSRLGMDVDNRGIMQTSLDIYKAKRIAEVMYGFAQLPHTLKLSMLLKLLKLRVKYQGTEMAIKWVLSRMVR